MGTVIEEIQNAARAVSDNAKQYFDMRAAIQALLSTLRKPLTAELTLYVQTTGSDTNNGLANTPAGAFKTIQAAVFAALYSYDAGRYKITIQVGDGRHAGFAVGRAPGVAIDVIGNLLNPAACIIDGAAAAAVQSRNGSALTLMGFRILSATGDGLLADDRSTIAFDKCEFGCGGSAIVASQSSSILCFGQFGIVGGGQNFMVAASNSTVNITGAVVTLSGTPNFSQYFAWGNNGFIGVFGVTFRGTGATGVRYNADVTGLVFTGAAGANFLPGSIAGSTSTGGLYV